MQGTVKAETAGGAPLDGIMCGIGAGAIWGLVFLAPELARTFPPLSLAAGRYLAFGLISACLIAPRLRMLLPRIGRREWMSLFWLSLTGNTLNYVLFAKAVQTGGVAMTSLILGLFPVAMTVVGSRDRGAAPLRKLAPSLLFCIGGAICIGWQAIAAPAPGAFRVEVTGLVCAIGALACWTGYAVGNTRLLARLGEVSVHDWTLLTGVVTGAQSLILIPFAMVLDTTRHSALDWAHFGGVSLGAAILASIVGNSLWNRMSRLLPLTLVGQMILCETLFALIYGFIWEQRPPRPLELAAAMLVALSVLSCIAAHRKPSPAFDEDVAVAFSG